MCVEAIVNAIADAFENGDYDNLTGAQRAVLRSILENPRETYRDMATRCGYGEGSLRGAGSDLFRQLSRLVGSSVAKSNCNDLVRGWYRIANELQNIQVLGRERDLFAICDQIASKRKRVVCLYGPPGIGKSYLARLLYQQLLGVDDGGFTGFRPYRATNVPTVKDLCQQILSDLKRPRLSETEDFKVALIRLLREERFLLLVDGIDDLHDPESLSGRFRSDSLCYEDWLGSISDLDGLNSCVVLLCRVRPRCLKGYGINQYSHLLRPLDVQPALQLFRQKAEKYSYYPQPDVQSLLKFCGFNPGVLIGVAEKLNSEGVQLDDIFDNLFVEPHGVDGTWEGYLQKLTHGENKILGWLLLYPYIKIRRQAGGLYAGEYDLNLDQSVLTCLRERGLVSFDTEGCPNLISDWVRLFVAKHVSTLIAKAYVTQKLEDLNAFPVTVAKAPLWFRRWQEKWVLAPRVDQLYGIGSSSGSWSQIRRAEQIRDCLRDILASDTLKNGFAVGNLLNLAVLLPLPLKDLPCSEVTLRNVDFSTKSLQGLRLQESRLIDCVLPVHLHGQLIAAMSPDGRTIAVGDTDGRICCWHRQEDFDFYELFRFVRIKDETGTPLPIKKLAFGNETMLGVVADNVVFRWWLGTVSEPESLMTVPAPVASLACCADEYVAVGLENGDIYVKQDMEDEAFALNVQEKDFQRGHTGRVKILAANPDPNIAQLLSIGMGDRVLSWNIDEPDKEPKEFRRLHTVMYFNGLAFRPDGWVASIFMGEKNYLRLEDGALEELPYTETLSKFCFSPNGAYFAVRKANEIDVCSFDLSSTITIPSRYGLSSMLLSNNGRWLLTIMNTYPHTVQVWDVHKQSLCWELSAEEQKSGSKADHSEIQLNVLEGLSHAERAFWADYGANM